MNAMIQRDGLLDRAAVTLSGLCLVHCIATAFFIAAAASLGGLLIDARIHEFGLMLAIGFGFVGLGRGVLIHGFVMPAAVGALGLGIMAGSLTLPHGGIEIMYTILGVTVLALGHDLNFRATH